MTGSFCPFIFILLYFFTFLLFDKENTAPLSPDISSFSNVDMKYIFIFSALWLALHISNNSRCHTSVISDQQNNPAVLSFSLLQMGHSTTSACAHRDHQSIDWIWTDSWASETDKIIWQPVLISLDHLSQVFVYLITYWAGKWRNSASTTSLLFFTI